MMLPLYIRLRVRDEESRGLNLYLPMVLLYILLLPVILLFLVLWLLFCLFTAGTARGKAAFKLVPALYVLFCAARGTEIEVTDKDSEIILKIK